MSEISARALLNKKKREIDFFSTSLKFHNIDKNFSVSSSPIDDPYKLSTLYE